MLGARQPLVATIHQPHRLLVIGRVGLHRGGSRGNMSVNVLRPSARKGILTRPRFHSVHTCGTETGTTEQLADLRFFVSASSGFPCGSIFPSYFFKSGLGSNVSTCDGPPFKIDVNHMLRPWQCAKVRRPGRERTAEMGGPLF